ncbi:molybdopterin-dependent oxidoreductase [Gordonibacter sp.]|uniref:molybdopterin-dependent oxidoreductase n=2 Tax=Gordonibacter sp. TaxID=1968902 RepID=UPI002FC99FF5
MTESTAKPRGFSRRNFIKGAAALTAAGALVGCSPQTKNLEKAKSNVEVIPDEIFSGACRGQCLSGCFLNVHVRDGQVVRTTARDFPDTRYNRICPKGLTHVGRIYSTERLQYPMKRIGERGEGMFERISWDEAIQEIADKWTGYAKEFGAESLAFFIGSGNCAICGGGTAPGSAMARLREVLGAAKITPDRDMASVERSMAMLGNTPWQGGNEQTDYKNAKTFVNWGSNPAISQVQTMHFILDAKDAGAKLIDIDIAYNTVASKSDWFIPIKPGADGALALGVLCEVFSQGWQDIEFLRKSTEAPFLIKEDGKYLRKSDFGVEPIQGDPDPATGKPVVIDPLVVWDEESGSAVAIGEAKKPALENVPAIEGVGYKTVYDIIKEQLGEWTVEKASDFTGVPVEDIKELARVYAQEGPVYTYSQYGCNHYNNGPYNYGPIYSLVLATGNAGKSGAGAGLCIGGGGNVANNVGTLKPKDSSGNPIKGGGRNVNWNQVANVVATGMLRDKPFPLKSVYVSCSNPLACQTEHRETVSVFKELEFVVVQDMVLTETAKYADILLPACHWFETTELRVMSTNVPYLIWQDKAIEPLYESKADFEIYKLLAEKMGYGEFFDMEPEDYIRLWLDSDAARALGITFDKLKEEKSARFLPGETFISFDGGVFTTKTKRALFYQETVKPSYNVGQAVDESKERTFLYWEPALEADMNSPAREKFPFSVCSDHLRTRTHVQWWDVGYMKEFEPYPIVRLNPDDAVQLGIKEGDTVKLSNDRGFVTMLATINSGQQPKTISCPRSFQAGEFIDGHFADLSFNDYNQCCANQAYNDVVVAVEKV